MPKNSCVLHDLSDLIYSPFGSQKTKRKFPFYLRSRRKGKENG